MPRICSQRLPRLVHSLDLAAEDHESESYRALLHEIDRAFQSFDHMAVRHGWMSGGAADTPPIEEPNDIDVPAFVASVLPADGRVPAAWARDLEGLPGYDRSTGRVRLTNDPARLRDGQGQALMYPGRSHPLTRRAVTAARTSGTGRVSAARGNLSLLATYAVETSGVVSRRLFALRMFPDGTIREEPDWLSLADAEPAERCWDRLFASWVEMDRLHHQASAVGQRVSEEYAAAQRDRLDREDAVAQAWLERRTDKICGARKAAIGDLFDTMPLPPDWRSSAQPEQRLAGFAADSSQNAASRRDAAEVLAQFRSRLRPEMSPPLIRGLGLLMLVP